MDVRRQWIGRITIASKAGSDPLARSGSWVVLWQNRAVPDAPKSDDWSKTAHHVPIAVARHGLEAAG